ncbi:gcn5-related n-acetyltransferase [Moniliophthora roreri MCA 2997]|uniref:Gcn5-related n-acetyltransferase n=2 Tax=Moniliophthora roreri TaxID=221103 RepID=V2XKX0_MONRO|nr:gcn5-related n-acetyltransferase [Moniliophthora roreri MCA 2997]KAI3612350.1 gcn5-related n-acetyltransferase [Moniliophthora roreri]
MSLTIRKATEDDIPALSRICLLTADAGQSAESLHDFKELPGLIFAIPYVKLPTTWAFVLVDESKEGEVVGYVVGSKDTREYERYAMGHWWPPLAAKYPPSLAVKEADARYMKMLQSMFTAPEHNIAFAAAHLHINILPEHQGKGWGRKMINAAIEYLKGENIEGNGVWLGMDPRNENARKFYYKMGFKPIEGVPDTNVGLKFA